MEIVQGVRGSKVKELKDGSLSKESGIGRKGGNVEGNSSKK